MNHPYFEKVFLLDYGLGLFEGSWWEMHSVWNANRLEETQTFSQQGTILTFPLGDSRMTLPQRKSHQSSMHL